MSSSRADTITVLGSGAGLPGPDRNCSGYLLQTGKGGGMGVAFGGSGGSVFGPRGAGSFIGKLTGVVAMLFMVSSILLAYTSS